MLETLKDRLRFTREPIAYLAAAVGAAYVAYEVLVNGAAVQAVVGDNLGELLLGALVAGLARLSVVAPATAEDLRAEKNAELELLRNHVLLGENHDH